MGKDFPCKVTVSLQDEVVKSCVFHGAQLIVGAH